MNSAAIDFGKKKRKQNKNGKSGGDGEGWGEFYTILIVATPTPHKKKTGRRKEDSGMNLINKGTKLMEMGRKWKQKKMMKIKWTKWNKVLYFHPSKVWRHLFWKLYINVMLVYQSLMNFEAYFLVISELQKKITPSHQAMKI